MSVDYLPQLPTGGLYVVVFAVVAKPFDLPDLLKVVEEARATD